MPDFKPIPSIFYDNNAWHDNIDDYYGDKPKYLPKIILDSPVRMLTNSITTSINIYGMHTDIMIDCFELTINPLYEPGEYKTLNYNACREAAIRNNDPRFNDLAEALYNIRRLFEKDKGFLPIHFAKEIAQVEGNTDEFKFTHFAEVISKITKIHVHQVVELIRSEYVVE